MAFDLCGIACGHFGLPFMTFFGATFIGKALIKASARPLSVFVCTIVWRALPEFLLVMNPISRWLILTPFLNATLSYR